MADDCCQLVGDLDLGLNIGCIISVNSSCSTEMTNACGADTPYAGPSTQTVTLAGYAADEIYIGCAGSASVNINWLRKYDCVEDKVHFIFAGEGEASITGEVAGLAEVKYQLGPTDCLALSASSQSGPSSIYTITNQIMGYGMIFRGTPIEFNTDAEGTTINLGGLLAGTYYLQSFSLEMQPGQLPIANYTMVRDVTT